MIPGFRLLAVAVVDIIYLRKKMIYVAAANTVWRSKCVIQVSCQHINTSLMCIWDPEHALKTNKNENWKCTFCFCDTAPDNSWIPLTK